MPLLERVADHGANDRLEALDHLLLRDVAGVDHLGAFGAAQRTGGPACIQRIAADDGREDRRLIDALAAGARTTTFAPQDS